MCGWTKEFWRSKQGERNIDDWEQQNTCILIDKSKDKKVIGVKWI